MNTARLDRTLAGLPALHPGPGGAAVVLKDGAVLARHCWGWADAERRLPFTPETLFRICSITKQFVCATLLELFPDPAVLDADLRAAMPRLHAPPPIARLAHNQSGLRDYWATAMLCGAPAEGVFGPEESRDLIARTASLQFAPGMRYSYCNQNFRLIGEVLEARTGQSLATLLRRRVFDPAGMPRALLCPETSAMPDGTIGYEGSLEEGWRPAVNRIHWTGDAGIAASLEDMIAWEQAIDAARDNPAGRMARQSAPVTFADGAEAGYGFGLSRMTLFGRQAIGHGGGLRGWRSLRFYVPAERVSVVVLFNHMQDPRPAAMALLGAVLDAPEPPPPEAGTGWDGHYIEPETGLAARIATQPDSRLKLDFATGPDTLTLRGGVAEGGTVRLRRTADGIEMARGTENMATLLQPADGGGPQDVEGVFHNAEYDATLTIQRTGSALYGAFSGFLGRGMMQPLRPAGGEAWRLPCARSLDYSAPGDWTLRVRRDASGRVAGLQVGCWLARGLEFSRA